jgi:hypothetical protein
MPLALSRSSSVPKPKTADLEALLEALVHGGVEFVVVGGAAAVLHGAPVTTVDLDIVHRRSDENVDRLLAVLDALEAEVRPPRDPPIRPTREMLLGQGQLNLATSLGPLDPLCQLHSGEGYEELIDKAVLLTDGDLEIRAIDLDTLIRIKSEAGRDRDKLAVPILIALRNRRTGE